MPDQQSSTKSQINTAIAFGRDETIALARCVLIATIMLGLMARVLAFQSPLFDLHAWRQADTAAIARNFANERFNPLYPQVDHRGNRATGYVETGLELYGFAVAAIARVVGFSTEIGRLLSASLFPFATLLLYRFIAERYGTVTALIGAAIYALGLPLTMYIDRAFMNESLLALLSIAAVRSAQLYLRDKAWPPLLSLLLTTSLIAAIKPTYLIVWGPVAGLFAEHYGRRAALRAELWVLVLVNLGVMAVWFHHAHSLFLMTGLTFGLTDKLFDVDLLLSHTYVAKIATRMVRDVLSPVGAVFLIVGLWSMRRRRKLAEVAGVISFTAYLIVVTVGNFHHNYYQLPIVPVAAVLIAIGIADTVERFGARRGLNPFRVSIAAVAVVAAAAFSTFVRNVSFHNWYEIDSTVVYLCNEVRPRLGSSERVVIVGSKSPALLFCLDRKGWLLDPEEASAERLTQIIGEGARTMIIDRSADQALRFLARTGTLGLTAGPWAVYRIDSAHLAYQAPMTVNLNRHLNTIDCPAADPDLPECLRSPLPHPSHD